MKIREKNTSFGAGGEPETSRLREAIAGKSSELFDLGSGCLALQTSGGALLFYDPQKVVVEFFTGGGSTTYAYDTDQVHRVVVDSAFSKAQMKRAHRSPYYSGRYAFEWHGKTKPMEVPFPLYMDDNCVIAWVKKGNLILPRNGSAVPHLERASDIADIAFVSSSLEPATDKGLEAFLSGVVPKGSLTELAGRMSHAYALRKEAGPEKPYAGLTYLKV